MSSNSHLSDRHRIRKEIQTARLVFQPIVHSGRIHPIDLEALIRPTILGKELSVVEWLEQVERQGLTYELDQMVISRVAEVMSAWVSQGITGTSVSINLFNSTLATSGFIGWLERLIRCFDLNADRFVLEVSEQSVISDIAKNTVIPALSQLGVRFAIDDFLHGYANFSALINPSLSIIKIDRSLVQEIESSPLARKFIRALVNLVHAVEKSLIIEGVETTVQYEFLESVGYQSFQGFYFFKPLSEDQIASVIRDTNVKQCQRIGEVFRDAEHEIAHWARGLYFKASGGGLLPV